MNKNEVGAYTVIHPLQDGPEEKRQVLAPLKKTIALTIILVTLRMYLIAMAIIVLIAVLKLAHVF